MLLYGHEGRGLLACPYYLPLSQSPCLHYAVTESILPIILPTVPHLNYKPCPRHRPPSLPLFCAFACLSTSTLLSRFASFPLCIGPGSSARHLCFGPRTILVAITVWKILIRGLHPGSFVLYPLSDERVHIRQRALRFAISKVFSELVYTN